MQIAKILKLSRKKVAGHYLYQFDIAHRHLFTAKSLKNKELILLELDHLLSSMRYTIDQLKGEVSRS